MHCYVGCILSKSLNGWMRGINSATAGYKIPPKRISITSNPFK